MQSDRKANNRKVSPVKPAIHSSRTQTKVQSELKRLQKITKGVIPETSRSVAMPLMHNLAFQKVKLEECRRDLMGEKLFVPYDNGGGQSGIREHPGFNAYNKLFTTFARGIKQLIDLMDGSDEEVDELRDYFNETKVS